MKAKSIQIQMMKPAVLDEPPVMVSTIVRDLPSSLPAVSPVSPVVREPVREVIQEPVYISPVVREPVREEPVYISPVVREPVREEPVYISPVVREPVREVIQEPVISVVDVVKPVTTMGLLDIALGFSPKKIVEAVAASGNQKATDFVAGGLETAEAKAQENKKSYLTTAKGLLEKIPGVGGIVSGFLPGDTTPTQKSGDTNLLVYVVAGFFLLFVFLIPRRR